MAFRAVWQAGSAFVVACLVGAPGIVVPPSVAVAVCGLASFGVRRAMPVWPPVTALPAFGWQQAMGGWGLRCRSRFRFLLQPVLGLPECAFAQPHYFADVFLLFV